MFRNRESYSFGEQPANKEDVETEKRTERYLPGTMEYLKKCFSESICPHPDCQRKVKELTAVQHEGFCKEDHYRRYVEEYGPTSKSYQSLKAEAEPIHFLRDEDTQEDSKANEAA